MSVDLISAALWLPLEPNRKLVLVALCDRADIVTGLCFPGREYIAARTSLSVKSVTPHLRALAADGWVRRTQAANARLGQATRRWLDVQKILSEGEQARDVFRAEQRRKGSGEETSPDQLALLELGEDDVIDQGKLTDGSGEAASREYVSNTSDHIRQHGKARSRDPIATAAREGAVRSTDVGSGGEKATSARRGGDMDAFGRALLAQRIHPLTLDAMAEHAMFDGEGVVLRVICDDEQLYRQLTQEPERSMVGRAAEEAGYRVSRVEARADLTAAN